MGTGTHASGVLLLTQVSTPEACVPKARAPSEHDHSLVDFPSAKPEETSNAEQQIALMLIHSGQAGFFV